HSGVAWHLALGGFGLDPAPHRPSATAWQAPYMRQFRDWSQCASLLATQCPSTAAQRPSVAHAVAAAQSASEVAWQLPPSAVQWPYSRQIPAARQSASCFATHAPN